MNDQIDAIFQTEQLDSLIDVQVLVQEQRQQLFIDHGRDGLVGQQPQLLQQFFRELHSISYIIIVYQNSCDHIASILEDQVLLIELAQLIEVGGHQESPLHPLYTAINHDLVHVFAAFACGDAQNCDFLFRRILLSCRLAHIRFRVCCLFLRLLRILSGTPVTALTYGQNYLFFLAILLPE